MVLPGLLVIALVSVIVGVVAASVPWLIASLVASVLAALVLIRSWGTIKERRTQMAGGSKPDKAAGKSWWRGRRAAENATPGEPTVAAVASGVPPAGAAPAGPEVVVVDGRPEYHAAGCARLRGLEAEAIPLSQAVEDGFTPCPVCGPPGAPDARTDPAVWVVDGSPEYHEQTCSTLEGFDAEPIPLSQAIEDGFVRCTVCRPGSSAPAAPASPAAREIWVADGYPEYHRAGCAELTGLDSEPVPYEQALEDGFQPCVVCNPDAELAPAGMPARADHAEVWVVDGQPDYHRASCARLAGEDGEPIPFAQAVEDGFTPCVACAPDAELPDAGLPDTEVAHAEVWVADGFPDYHVAGCHELNGLDAEPIPFDQAVEDDFQPCEVCKPHLTLAAAPPAPEPQAEPEPTAAAETARQVWVVDGRPRYHAQDCLIIKGQQARSMPFDEALEQGFAACSFCQRAR